MKTGVIRFTHEIVVDLDNKEMVEDAKEAFYEDVMSAYRYDHLDDMIGTEERPSASQNDIPDYLLEMHDPKHPNYEGDK